VSLDKKEKKGIKKGCAAMILIYDAFELATCLECCLMIGEPFSESNRTTIQPLVGNI
jgi:hypothetical protein